MVGKVGGKSRVGVVAGGGKPCRGKGSNNHTSLALGLTQPLFHPDTCKRLDVDGVCDPPRPERRRHLASVTVGLEKQARTLAERQAMVDGEMELRQIDVLWICTVSAPVAQWAEASPTALEVLDKFRVDSD